MKSCSAEDCETPAHSRGMCVKHYKRARRRGLKPKTEQERFQEKYDVVDGCWQWLGHIMKDGYGGFQYQGEWRLAHRASYDMHVGPIPAGLEVDHKCHNRACVNPEHLRTATHHQNSQYRSGAQANSKSGVRGVHQDKTTGRWVAQVQSRYGHHLCKRFDTREEAEAAVIAKRAEVFDFPEQGLAA